MTHQLTSLGDLSAENTEDEADADNDNGDDDNYNADDDKEDQQRCRCLQVGPQNKKDCIRFLQKWPYYSWIILSLLYGIFVFSTRLKDWRVK